MTLIRTIKKEDYEAVDRLLLQLHKIHVNGRPELFQDLDCFMSRESFENLINSDEMIAILMEKRKQIVGCCFVSILNHCGMVKMRTAYIDQIVVNEKFRRKGIGKAMIRYVQRRAKQLGAKRLDLMVWSHNKAAIHAYQSYGMIPQRLIFEKDL